MDGGWQGISDGSPFMAVRSHTGEYRFHHGGRALFGLSADHQTLLSAVNVARDTAWWRVLLDSVLFTVSLLRGNDALHAGTVVTAKGALAIAAPSGSGKSTLLAQLLRQGYPLVSDDITFLERRGGEVLAHPGPPLMTLSREHGSGVGTRLGDVGDDVWVTVSVVDEPVPLRRLVLLDRRGGAVTGMRLVERPLAPLMTHLLNFPRTGERELARFTLASALATRVEMRELVADVTVPPQELAALAIQGLDE
jgi:hypothetical protein